MAGNPVQSGHFGRNLSVRSGHFGRNLLPARPFTRPLGPLRPGFLSPQHPAHARVLPLMADCADRVCRIGRQRLPNLCWTPSGRGFRSPGPPTFGCSVGHFLESSPKKYRDAQGAPGVKMIGLRVSLSGRVVRWIVLDSKCKRRPAKKATPLPRGRANRRAYPRHPAAEPLAEP